MNYTEATIRWRQVIKQLDLVNGEVRIMGTSEMNLFLVIRRSSDRHFYSGSTANGSPAFTPSIANAKVFFLKDHKDISKYQEFATRLGASVMVFSYQLYSNAEQESNRLAPLSLNEKKVLPTAGWYPNGTPSFQYPHMVCARCGAKVVGSRETPPSSCHHCGLIF